MISTGLLRCGANTLDLNQVRPFANLPAQHPLTTAIDSFVWLADLKAAGTPKSAEAAVRLLETWIADREVAAETAPSAILCAPTRLRTCLANGDLLLNGCDVATFEQFSDLLSRDVGTLETAVTKGTLAPVDLARALMALVLSSLVLEGCEDLGHLNETALAAALDSAIHPDGSPVSRSRDDAIE